MSAVVEQVMVPYHQANRFTLYEGDCRSVLPCVSDCSVDSIVCDPPYELGFMGKGWDRSGIAYEVSVWRECLRILKPGAHLLAFGGSRTYHRLACAIEDAGFEIRDQIQWLYGSGFPKSLDVSKAIDAASGADRAVIEIRVGPVPGTHGGSGRYGHGEDRSTTSPATDAAKQWDGWGTALKPAHEPIVLARKPLIAAVAENVLQHGTGGLNIDGCRIETGDKIAPFGSPRKSVGGLLNKTEEAREGYEQSDLGRWPANVIHDGSDEVLAGFPETDNSRASMRGTMGKTPFSGLDGSGRNPTTNSFRGHADTGGSAARFFYCAKATQEDRNEGLEDLPLQSAGAVTDRKDGSAGLNSPRAGAGRTNGSRNPHPTVKPTELMRYLCRLITPPGGLVLDPFCGSGSTGKAAMLEGLRFVGIELNADYCELAQRRIEAVTKQGLLFT